MDMLQVLKMLKPHQVSIETEVLRNQLNQAHAKLRSRGGSATAIKNFQDLWDINEKALLERESRVTVPTRWLAQIEEQIDVPVAAG